MKIQYRRHAERIGIFALLYLLGAGLAISHPGPWALPAYLLAAASLHGISLFAHEAVHGTLAPGRLANGLAGALCALPVLQNCSAYRVLHLRHHRHLGDEGDPDHYANYTRRGWLLFMMNWARLLVGYPVYITAIPILGFRRGNLRDRVAILGELAALGALALWVWRHVPGSWLFHGWLLPMLLINTMVNIRGMSQHTLLEHANDEIQGTRSILTTPLVRFFMCNENYHLEHHLHPGVPWYGLPELHRKLESDLRRQGAPYIRSYSAFVQEFLADTWRKARE